MWFIHKYTDGKMVKFTKVAQVKHKMTYKFDCIVGDYIRLIRGRIAKIEKIYKKDINTSKYPDQERIENVYIFSIKFLDNNEMMELTPNVTMGKVKINRIDYYAYLIYKIVFKINNQ